MSRTFIALGAVMAALAIGLGAFGAHALKGLLTPKEMGWFDTAAHYHLIHAVGLVALGAAGQALGRIKLLSVAAWAMLAGTLIFSGSLYLMAAGGPRWLGAITPIGGTALIAAWLLLAVAAIKATNR